jgi:hypothetical protein
MFGVRLLNIGGQSCQIIAIVVVKKRFPVYQLFLHLSAMAPASLKVPIIGVLASAIRPPKMGEYGRTYLSMLPEFISSPEYMNSGEAFVYFDFAH